MKKKIENMKEEVEKIEVEKMKKSNKNVDLKKNLENMRDKINERLKNINIKGKNEVKKLNKIDNYMKSMN
jgi:predicted  nucleic acid-binding Zn-ribbon protein